MTGLPAPRSVEVWTHSGHADGGAVAALRHLLRAWLTSTVDIGAERLCDMVLAADEAVANAVDHAYRDFAGAGMVTLDLLYRAWEASIEIRVRDQGRWRAPAPIPISAIRGRGLILMRSLADVCTVDGSTNGTTVTLTFHGCCRLERIPADFA